MTGTEGGGTPPPLQNFYVTFGMVYRYEPHPYWPAADPDGWLLVKAPDEDAARLLLRECIGTRYAFIYPESYFRRDWLPLGEIAMISTDGTSWVSRTYLKGNANPPVRQFGPSDCQYYGHDTNEVVCARIEGILAEHSDKDAIEQLGYEVEHVHKACLTDGLALFATVYEVDSRVMAGELDWSHPYPCPVCEESIT